MDSYKENDKEYFFGRDEDVTELLELVFRYNILVLFGESGTGKTAVLNAGLIPNFGIITFQLLKFEKVFTRAGERDRLQLAEGITELTST